MRAREVAMKFKIKSMLAGAVLLLVLVQICLAAGQQDDGCKKDALHQNSSFSDTIGLTGRRNQRKVALPAREDIDLPQRNPSRPWTATSGQAAFAHAGEWLRVLMMP